MAFGLVYCPRRVPLEAQLFAGQVGIIAILRYTAVWHYVAALRGQVDQGSNSLRNNSSSGECASSGKLGKRRFGLGLGLRSGSVVAVVVVAVVSTRARRAGLLLSS